MYAVNDKTLLEKGKTVETFGSHSEAVQAAQDRAKSASGKRSRIAMPSITKKKEGVETTSETGTEKKK